MKGLHTAVFVACVLLDSMPAWPAFACDVPATDRTYGYGPINPIKVGGIDRGQGPANERRFLDALRGPQGQPLSYVRRGSCCPFHSAHGLMGQGLLDVYAVTYEGLSQPVELYLNMYEDGPAQVPVGFTCSR